jgi:two-component system OmpR family response regulator
MDTLSPPSATVTVSPWSTELPEGSFDSLQGTAPIGQPGQQMRVMLVEDDSMIGDAVQAALRDASYAVDWIRDGGSSLATLAAEAYDLILLDLGPPQRHGLELLASLRGLGSTVPVVIIDVRGGLGDGLRGPDGGADDYVLKPFEMAELLAHLRAVLRRRGSAQPVLGNGMVQLDPATRQARVRDAAPVLLSNREFALLKALLLRAGAILSRSELEDKIYAWGEEVESSAVEYLIHAVRRTIKNVRGLGWMVPRQG